MKNLTQLIQENKKLKNQILEYKQVLGGHLFILIYYLINKI